MVDSSVLAALRAHGPRLIDSIENAVKRRKASFALQSLAESLQRLAMSYDEYQKAAQRYRLDKRINPAGPSGTIQTAPHDAHHAFHQCVYATLSSLVSSMNQVKDAN
jgi:hypothetical protein